MHTPGLTDVLISLILVGLAIGISRYWQIPVAKEMAIGSARSFVQLIAVGYALEFIFGLESPWLIIAALLIMIVVGAYTSSGRVKNLSGVFLISFIAMIVAAVITIGLMLALSIIRFEARYIIPLGGMIIGNSMNASALSIDRITSDIRDNRLAVETSLALGKGWRVAAQKFIRSSTTTGMISMLNSMKTLGIVALPGAMTGMILAGTDPLQAVYLQIIVVYMLISAVTVTSVISVEMTVRKFFTRYHQLSQIV